MATTKNNDAQSPAQAVSAMLDEQKAKAEGIVKDIGSGVVSITAKVKELAEVVVYVRGHITRSVKSKKTEKVVQVPDWDGRSPEYKEWYANVLLPMIEEHIPQEFRGTIRTRLQNQVQEVMHKTATAAQKAHLGIAAQSKATTQEQKRQAAKAATKAASAPARESQEILPGDDVAASFEAVGIVDACQYLARACSVVRERTGKNGWSEGMSKADRKRCDDLLKQALSNLMTARATVEASISEGTPARTRVAA